MAPELRLPDPNPFMATDFSLRCEGAPEPVDAPLLLRDDHAGKVFYKLDAKFKQPKIQFKMALACPPAFTSPRATVLADLFTRLVKESLNEYEPIRVFHKRTAWCIYAYPYV